MPWIGAAVAIGGSLISGSMGSSAANDAANTQAQSTQAGIDETRRQYDLSRSDQAPYRQAGTNALSRLQYLLGLGGSGGGSGSGSNISSVASMIKSAFPTWSATGIAGQPGSDADIVRSFASTAPNILADKNLQQQWSYGAPEVSSLGNLLPQAQAAASGDGSDSASADYGSLNKKFSVADFWNDPVVQASYQSGLDLGTKALKNAAPLTTGLDSGAAMKELTKFGTDYTGNMAAGSQGRYVNDQTNQFNRLAGMAGVGQQAVNATTAAGTNMANNVSGLISAQGNANAGAKIAGANAWGNGVSSVSNWWNQNQMLNSFKNAAGNGSYSGWQMPGQFSTSNPQYG